MNEQRYSYGEGFGVDYEEYGFGCCFANQSGNGSGKGSYNFSSAVTGSRELICGFDNIFDGKPCYSVILMESQYHVG